MPRKTTGWRGVKVDKDIPLPDRQADSLRGLFDAMEVGDSFLVPPGTKEAAIRSTASNHKMKVSIRNTEEGRRVWLTKKFSS